MKKSFIAIALILLFYSCSSYNTMIKANDNVKLVNLGMSKKKVISIMGKDTYRLSGLSTNPDGYRVEKIWYPATQKSIFFFTFINDNLVEWHEEFLFSRSEISTE